MMAEYPDEVRKHPRFYEWTAWCKTISLQGGTPPSFQAWLKKKKEKEPKIGFAADIGNQKTEPTPVIDDEQQRKLRHEQSIAEAMRQLQEMTEFHQKHGKPLPKHEMLVLQGHNSILAKRWENPKNYELIPHEFSFTFDLAGSKASLRVVCLLPQHILCPTVQITSPEHKKPPTEEKRFNDNLAFRLKLAVEHALTPQLSNRTELPDHKWFLLHTESAIAGEVRDMGIPVCRVAVFPELIKPQTLKHPMGVHIGE
jgi:hypothetical protein